MKPYSAGAPYTARRIVLLRSGLERLSRRANMRDLMADGVEGFVQFQDDLLRLQAVIQRDITELKRTVRKNKDALPTLNELKRLRWLARCLGDSLAWQVLLFDRKAIAALMSGPKPGVAAISASSQAVVTMAGHLLGQGFGVPIVHDLTNWLRIGDITFMLPDQPADAQGNTWRFQTVELKTSIIEAEEKDDGTTHVQVTVNMYCNEPMGLPRADEKQIGVSIEPFDTADQIPAPRRKQDRRLTRQFKRMDAMVKRRDMDEDSITTIDGIPNVIVRVPHQETHHWVELRRAIREARRDGFAFFSVDNFIGYGLFYSKDGVTEAQMNRFGPVYRDRVQSELLQNKTRPTEFLLIREIPMKEQYDIAEFPIFRLFNYEIPRYAIRDIIYNRLIVTAVASFGRLDEALNQAGVSVAGIDLTETTEGYPYAVNVEWPTGDKFRFNIPSSQVEREVIRALYEFSGLDDVVHKVTSVKLVPQVISFDEWDASLNAQTGGNTKGN